MATYSYGGQALIEGVLMRGPGAIAVALRNPQGEILCATEKLDRDFHSSRWAKTPFVRGLVVLYDTLVTGTRWLIRSANVAASEEGVELGKGSVALMLIITMAAAIGIFFLLPLFIASVTAGSIENDLVQHILEGLVRVAIFLGYLLLIAQAPDVRRVFQYHGAEHMTIHALEHGDPLTIERIRRYPTAHPRCGTEFLVVVIILSIFFFSLIGRQPLPLMIASRILLIPVIAALGYELLRLGARYRSNPIVHALMAPGILVQKITTRQPTDDMIEVAMVSMEQALRANDQPIPASSDEPAWVPYDPRGAGARALAGDGVPTEAGPEEGA